MLSLQPSHTVSKEEDSGPQEQAPTTQQVSSFLSTLCNETEIVELHLQSGDFELRVKRSIKSSAAPVVAHSHVAAAPSVPEPAALAAPMPFSMEESVDESLIYVTSPKVGIFRAGRYAAGKRVGKANCVNKGDQVKRGQTLGFVEQLGTHVPVEAGELVMLHVEDGAPVEYAQLVAELAPFFGGHIIGDRKYA
ncbi:MAG: hypothetical protein WDW38_005102 [Sanguina aurantia]